MATNESKTSSKPKTIKKATTPKKKEVKPVNTVEPEAPVVNTPVKKRKMNIKEFDVHDITPVRNGFPGKLVYKSKKTGETFIWEEFGDYQDMEIAELRYARTSAKKFFTNNWFVIEDDDLVYALGLESYYKNAIKIDDFDKIFDMGPEELEATLSDLSDGQKRSVMYRAKALVADGKIDSMKIINVLEKNLGVELIER